MGSLRHGFVSELDSIGFVPALKHLEFQKFCDLTDGDIRPALASTSLKPIDCFPDRKHDGHTQVEANAAIVAGRRWRRQA